jgi:hypothetical protein
MQESIILFVSKYAVVTAIRYLAKVCDVLVDAHWVNGIRTGVFLYRVDLLPGQQLSQPTTHFQNAYTLTMKNIKKRASRFAFIRELCEKESTKESLLMEKGFYRFLRNLSMADAQLTSKGIDIRNLEETLRV